MPKIVEINHFGEVFVTFNSSMQLPAKKERKLFYQHRGNRTNETASLLDLRSVTYGLNLTIVDLESDDADTRKEMVNYTWECIDFKEKSMTLQIDFKTPNQVSTGQRPWIILLTFLDSDVFRDNNNSTVSRGYMIFKGLPR